MSNQKRPWYREPFVWLVIFFPAVAVVGGMITIRLAIVSNDGLVADDYYKQGLEINQVLERDKAANTHGLQATMQFDYDNQGLQLVLTAHAHYVLPEQVTLHFIHRTRPGLDKVLILKKGLNHTYRATLPDLVMGNWYIQLVADDWRLLKPVRLPTTQIRVVSHS